RGQVHDLERRQHLPQDGGQLRVLPGVLLDLRPFAAAQPLEEIIDDVPHEGFRRGALQLEAIAHSCDPVRPASNRIRCSRSIARPCRLLAVAGSMARRQATSWLDSPSKWRSI